MMNIILRRAYSVNQTNKLIADALWESFMLGEREETVVLRGRFMVNPDVKAILEAAVRVEEQSYTLYTIAQGKVEYSSSKKLLKELAQEELKHKEKLLAVMRDEKKTAELGAKAKVQDLKIVDAMKGTALSEDADYQRILVFAAKREKATYEYYNSLARGLEGTETGELFSRLAQEELTHKNRLEKEYDEYLLKEN
jgi:rubrerythrin